MEPKEKEVRQINGNLVDVADIDDNSVNMDDYMETGDNSYLSNSDPTNPMDSQLYKFMSDENIKIAAIKQAINIVKIYNEITVPLILEIADKVAHFIKDYKVGAK